MFFKRIQLANSPYCKTSTWIVIAAFLFSTACTTTRVISSKTIEPQPDTLANELKEGDFIKVTTKDGNTYTFGIADLTSEAIFGPKKTRGVSRRQEGTGRIPQQILFTDIVKIEKMIEKKQVSFERTTILIIIWGALIVGSIVIASEFNKNCCGVGDLGGN